MSFNDIEVSDFGGQPTELYEFRYGALSTDILRFTSADHDLDLNGATYQSLFIERDNFTSDGNPDDNQQMNIRLSRDNPFGELYRSRDFPNAIGLKIRGVHLNDPDLQIITLWSGRVTGVGWDYPLMTVGCERMSTSLKRSGLTARYQVGMCRHVLYQPGCGLIKESYRVDGTVGAVSSATLLTVAAAAGYPDGWFTGGILYLDGMMRYITGHAGSSIQISQGLRGLVTGSEIRLYPSCDRLASTCSGKFNNIENYGGFDYIPPKGPFEGNSLV